MSPHGWRLTKAIDPNEPRSDIDGSARTVAFEFPRLSLIIGFLSLWRVEWEQMGFYISPKSLPSGLRSIGLEQVPGLGVIRRETLDGTNLGLTLP